MFLDSYPGDSEILMLHQQRSVFCKPLGFICVLFQLEFFVV